MRYKIRAFQVPEFLPDGRSVDRFEEEDEASSGQIVVHEDDEQWTGLLDAEGNPLYRVRNKIGFV